MGQFYITGNRWERLDNIAREIKGHAIVADVTKAQEVDIGLMPHCDLLVNCAGGVLGVDTVGQANVPLSDRESCFFTRLGAYSPWVCWRTC